MFDAIAILIPAYDPTGALANLLAGLRDRGFGNIVIVDDGSDNGDSIAQAAEQFSLDLVRHPENRGKGAALKTGISYILEQCDADIETIITVDADGQHLCDDVVRIARCAQEHPGSLVLGVRDFSSTVPLRSALGNKLTRLVLQRAEHIDLRDTQTGLRALPREFARQSCALPADHYEFELESILLANRLGVAIEQLQVATVYLDGNASSHFRPIVDSMKIYAVFARFIGVSLLSFLIDITLFFVCYSLTSQVFTSTYLARSLSATLNFMGNKIFVFKSVGKLRAIAEATGYVVLVFLVATASAFLVDEINSISRMPIIGVKILVDASLFFCSFLAQRYLLFRN